MNSKYNNILWLVWLIIISKALLRPWIFLVSWFGFNGSYSILAVVTPDYFVFLILQSLIAYVILISSISQRFTNFRVISSFGYIVLQLIMDIYTYLNKPHFIYLIDILVYALIGLFIFKNKVSIIKINFFKKEKHD